MCGPEDPLVGSPPAGWDLKTKPEVTHCQAPAPLQVPWASPLTCSGHYGWNQRDRDHAGRWSQASEEGSRESGTIAAFHMASRAQRPLVGYTVSICHSAVEHSHLSL
jgi:hypothetical protein